MSAPKARGTTMVDKKLKKEREKNANLQEQLRASNFQVLNLRQMYEGVVGEKQGIINQLQRTTQMLLGAVIQARGKKIVLKESTIVKLNDFAGVDTSTDGADLVVTAVTKEDLEAMQDEIDADA